MERMGIDDKLIKLTRELYKNCKFKVEIEGISSEWKQQTLGIRQGCTLSPFLLAPSPPTPPLLPVPGGVLRRRMTDTMPITTSNFIDLCQSGFYDGIHFHRVSASCRHCSACLRLPPSA